MSIIQETVLHRYDLPSASFQSLDDAGMWVSRRDVVPTTRQEVGALLLALRRANIEVRPLGDLLALRGLWATSLHASGIRLRNAIGWSRQDDA